MTATALDACEADLSLSSKQVLNWGCHEATRKFEGSATAVVIKLVDGMVLETANLGDSGFAVYRVAMDNTLQLRFKSKPAQVSFNMPFQCGTGSDNPWPDI